LFDRGYYVQSVVFPAVPYHAGVIRIQVNANHTPASVEGLLGALSALRDALTLHAAPVVA
jgi:7-keto-8-aminopelargonate synthetase-like enzyme